MDALAFCQEAIRPLVASAALTADPETSAIRDYESAMRETYAVTQDELNADLHTLREVGIVLGKAMRDVHALLARTNHPATDAFFTDRVIEAVVGSCADLPEVAGIDLIRVWTKRVTA